jgi:hypothetical protein
MVFKEMGMNGEEKNQVAGRRGSGPPCQYP